MKKLVCAICGRQDVWGLISSMAWGTGQNGGDARACPDCVSKHGDWQQRIEQGTRA